MVQWTSSPSQGNASEAGLHGLKTTQYVLEVRAQRHCDRAHSEYESLRQLINYSKYVNELKRF